MIQVVIIVTKQVHVICALILLSELKIHIHVTTHVKLLAQIRQTDVINVLLTVVTHVLLVKLLIFIMDFRENVLQFHNHLFVQLMQELVVLISSAQEDVFVILSFFLFN